jgi:hypothetical protein
MRSSRDAGRSAARERTGSGYGGRSGRRREAVSLAARGRAREREASTGGGREEGLLDQQASLLLPLVEGPDGHVRVRLLFPPFHGEELAGQLGIGERKQPELVEPPRDRLEQAFPASTSVQ